MNHTATVQPRRVIGIVRVSTPGQVGEDKFGVERQRHDIEQTARALSLEIVRVLEVVESGSTAFNRADFKQMFADLADSRIAGVIVSSIDRLVRPGFLGDLQVFDPFQRHKKLLFANGQAIDVESEGGWLIAGMFGMTAGLEKRAILKRTLDGKKRARRAGRHVDGGAQTLPRGVHYSKATRKWSYEQPDAGRVALAIDLAFERRSWHDIAARIGGGFTYNGVKTSLKNPIWKGVRRFGTGDDAFELPVIETPLISEARWDALQQIILEKRTRWQKTKLDAPRETLLLGLLRCSCGRSMYVRSKRGTKGYYYCSTARRGYGPKCGAASARVEAVDAAFNEIAANRLLDSAFLKTVLGKLAQNRPARNQEAERIARERQKLESERQELLRLTLKKVCTESDYQRESKRIESELRSLDAIMPAPVADAIDPRKLIDALAIAFGQFAKQPFAERRAVLQAAVKEIVLDGKQIPEMTFNGGFFGANLSPHSRSRYSHRCRERAR